MKNPKNSVFLEGHAGSAPKITKFEKDKKVARVSIAVNEFYKNKDGEPVNSTMWFTLVFWNKNADLAKKIKKGSAFAIKGKLSTNSYMKDGVKRYSTEIIVDKLEFPEE